MTSEYESNIKKNDECHESWVSCAEGYPEEGKHVLIWRHKAKCYTVACLENSLDQSLYGLKNPPTTSLKWRTHSSSSGLKLCEKDFWRPFPYLIVTETYI